ncbi:MAG: hypothetical protein JEZ02_22010 [Desulfatibacillum sp.]|nr:hypothetical protein [Desulfatibacillum sp.]
MRQVKGTLLLPLAKTVNANKTGVYDSLISDEAKEIVENRILASAWYPFEVYKSIYTAVGKVVANDNEDLFHKWGIAEAERVFKDVYASIIYKGDAPRSIEMLNRFVNSKMFNFGGFDTEFLSENEMVASVEEFDRDFKVALVVLCGWMQRYLELCLDKPVKSEFLKRSWKEPGLTKMRFTWE